MRSFFDLCVRLILPITLCVLYLSVASGEMSEEQTKKLLEKISKGQTYELWEDLTLTVILLTTPEREGTAFVIDTSTLVTSIHNLKSKHGTILHLDQMRLGSESGVNRKRTFVIPYLIPFVKSENKVIGIKYMSELHGLAVLEADSHYFPTRQYVEVDVPTYPAPDTVVYTMGYPQGKFHIFKGVVISANDTEYIVALNGEGMHGLSGAPVYNERGYLTGAITRFAGNIAHATPVKYLNLDKLPPDTYYKIAIRKEKTGHGETLLEKTRRVGGTRGRIANAYPSLYREAQKGNALARFRMGEILKDRGKDSQAFNMFEKAAAGGSQNAQFALATLYVQRGEKEKATALLEDMLEKQHNYPPAVYNLGVLYLQEGKTHPENFRKAYNMFAMATEKYHSGAMYNMGLMLLKGEGVEKDIKRAKALFELAALLNFKPASQVLLSLENPEPFKEQNMPIKNNTSLSSPSVSSVVVSETSCKSVFNKQD